MARNMRSIYFLVAALGIGPAPPAMAWTSYGHGPQDTGYRGGYPETAPPESPPGVESYRPGLLPSTDRTGGGYIGQSPRRYGPQATSQAPSSDAVSPTPTDSGYGPRATPPWGYPDFGERSFGGRPLGFRVSRTTSPDAHILTVALRGVKPEEVQIRTQGHWLFLSQTYSAQEVRKDSFDDGRGLRRSFSYSSGTGSRRLSVPPDAILSGMSREDGEDSIRIRIPRRGRQGFRKE